MRGPMCAAARPQRHVDGLNVGRKRREFSFVLYLNKGWKESDRGHLRVYDSREVPPCTRPPPPPMRSEVATPCGSAVAT